MIEIKVQKITHIQEGDSSHVQAEVTPEQMAEAFWHMDSVQQGEFFHRLGGFAMETACNALMMQGLSIRQDCEYRAKNNPDDQALNAFLGLFAAAYKYMS